MSFRIAMDSAGEFTKEMTDPDVYVIVPLTLSIGGVDYTDDGTIPQKLLVEKIAESPTCPRTACPSPDAFYRAFDCSADHIYGVTISAELSGSYQSAIMAQNMYLEEHPGAKIHVFNSRSTSCAETIIVKMITEMEEAGHSFEDICTAVEAYCIRKHTFFVLDNLETLRKNGRLARIKALAAAVLKIKPICAGTENGEIIQVDQARGSNKALMKMVDQVVEKTVHPETRVLGITYVNCRERAIMVRDAILARIKVREVILQEAGGLSSTYANDGGIIVVI